MRMSPGAAPTLMCSRNPSPVWWIILALFAPKIRSERSYSTVGVGEGTGVTVGSGVGAIVGVGIGVGVAVG